MIFFQQILISVEKQMSKVKMMSNQRIFMVNVLQQKLKKWKALRGFKNSGGMDDLRMCKNRLKSVCGNSFINNELVNKITSTMNWLNNALLP